MKEAAYSLIAMAGGSLITYLLTLRKAKAETRKIKAETLKAEIDNMTEIVEMWRKSALDLKQKVEELQVEVDTLREYNQKLLKRLQKYEKADNAGHTLHGHVAGQRGDSKGN